MSDSLQPCGLYSPWYSPDQNTGVGNLSLLQGIFPTQRWDPSLPYCKQILYQLSHKGITRILDCQPIPSLADLPNPGIKTGSPALQVDSLLDINPQATWLTETKVHIITGLRDLLRCDTAKSSDSKSYALFISYLFYQFSSVAQSCLTLCSPMDFSMPGFLVHHHSSISYIFHLFHTYTMCSIHIINHTTNENLSYSTGNSTQCYIKT